MPQISRLLRRTEQDTKNSPSTVLLCSVVLKPQDLLYTQRFALAARTTCVAHRDISLTLQQQKLKTMKAFFWRSPLGTSSYGWTVEGDAELWQIMGAYPQKQGQVCHCATLPCWLPSLAALSPLERKFDLHKGFLSMWVSPALFSSIARAFLFSIDFDISQFNLKLILGNCL